MKPFVANILEVQIPFQMVFRHALASHERSHGVILRLSTKDGSRGYGECVPRAYVTGETPDSVLATLRDELLPALGDQDLDSFRDTVSWLQEVSRTISRDRLAAFCCLELALLDLMGKRNRACAGEVCGPRHRDTVSYSGVITASEPDQALQAVQRVKKVGCTSAKIKVGASPKADELLVRTAREELGPDCELRLDANCGWDTDEALERITHLAQWTLASIEQPIAAHDLDGLQWLTARSPVPIMVDESLASFDDAVRLIEHEACHLFNIRISKCGGLINACRIRDLAEQQGLGYQMGSQVGESAILSAAGRMFAAHSEYLLSAEGSFGTLLLKEDIAEEDLTFGPYGQAPAIVAPGLGVTINEDVLDRHTVQRLAIEGL